MITSLAMYIGELELYHSHVVLPLIVTCTNHVGARHLICMCRSMNDVISVSFTIDVRMAPL